MENTKGEIVIHHLDLTSTDEEGHPDGIDVQWFDRTQPPEMYIEAFDYFWKEIPKGDFSAVSTLRIEGARKLRDFLNTLALDEN